MEARESQLLLYRQLYRKIPVSSSVCHKKAPEKGSENLHRFIGEKLLGGVIKGQTIA